MVIRIDVDKILRKSHGWLISFAFHSILILILYHIAWPVSPKDERETIIEVTIEEEIDLEAARGQQDIPETGDEEDVPVVTEEEKPEEHIETVDEADTRTAEGADTDAAEDEPLDVIAVRDTGDANTPAPNMPSLVVAEMVYAPVSPGRIVSTSGSMVRAKAGPTVSVKDVVSVTLPEVPVTVMA